MARRDGQELFISEAQEKTLNRPALARLWGAHAEQAREAARAQWIAQQAQEQTPGPTAEDARASLDERRPSP
jgi:hypothetical protein